MTIHSSHPFADPHRVDGRQLRGRLGSRVSLWCAGSLDGTARAAGLTVTSLLVVPGEPWRVVGFLDPDSDVALTLTETGGATLALLEWRHRVLADMFAGLTPAPGGPFRHGDFEQTSHGPLLVGVGTSALLEIESEQEVGWSLQVTCRVVGARLDHEEEPLHHRRGRYTTLGPR